MPRKKLIIDTDPGIGWYERYHRLRCILSRLFCRASSTAPAWLQVDESLQIICSSNADDALAILAAFNSPEVEIVGMTTIYGNVPTSKATQNAVRLRELAGQEQVILTVSIAFKDA